MKGRRRPNRPLGLALAIAMTGAIPGMAAASCQEFSSLRAKFEQIYPTGGPPERFGGAAAERILARLYVHRAEAESVVFLYSGDGPVTGARGRYLYLVLDTDGCILRRDWIDGETHDQAVGDE